MNIRNPYYKDPYYSIICAVNNGYDTASKISKFLQKTTQATIHRQLITMEKDGIVKSTRGHPMNEVRFFLTKKCKKIRYFHHKFRNFESEFNKWLNLKKKYKIYIHATDCKGMSKCSVSVNQK